MGRALVAAAALCLFAPAAAAASVTVATNVQRPALRVDAKGNAEVSWTASGRRHYLLVPANGRFLPGARLPAADVSRAASGVPLPYLRVLRRTPDGRLWALQTWQVAFSKDVELRFSRWRGAPTQITLAASPSGNTELLQGRATFQGRPVTGTSPTNAGTPVLLAGFFDCSGCGAPGWVRWGAKRTAANGSFALTVPLKRRGTQYRVSITGPNRGTTLAPDASAIAHSAIR